MTTGLVRKAMRDGRASTDDCGVTWDVEPSLDDKRIARIGELEEEIATLPAGEHKADLVAELNKLRREAKRDG